VRGPDLLEHRDLGSVGRLRLVPDDSSLRRRRAVGPWRQSPPEQGPPAAGLTAPSATCRSQRARDAMLNRVMTFEVLEQPDVGLICLAKSIEFWGRVVARWSSVQPLAAL
jgi:hypothetical protein